MALATTRRQALDLAERLIGSFANCRPPDPKQFADSVALVLEKYPLGLAEEACDPTRGAALAMDWLGLKALGDWLDQRLEFYRSLAYFVGHRPRPVMAALPDNPAMAERVHGLLRGLAAALRADTTRSPLDLMIDRCADARRLRIEEVMRRAAETVSPASHTSD